MPLKLVFGHGGCAVTQYFVMVGVPLKLVFCQGGCTVTLVF